ncbi:DUF4142 domain-containing protein [Rufibacter glacialis]|uniref:DUF4142 domain-containing protein n=1 Tax=Rufibacter glacialis TaxID=1259555 RepID=A0A5M8QE41_9BACT|nr:DUF4142 domain-containing protein [Rufibacter glacialis]KAA6433273.1 DUF4142 domain-containing protein [Rufibacter glacialis]GGK75961.1 hypothetical protein GCM10011405_24680 [Rufibacter glacialis]
MKKLLYVITAGGFSLLTGTACSRIDANTSNTVPTSDAYAATVTAGAGTSGSTARADAMVTTSPGGTVPGTMMYGTRTITEATFLMEAASSGMMEVQLGKLALERSADPKVKQFAQMIIDHHTKTNQELAELAAGMNVTLPTALMPDHQKLVDKLSKLTGKAFDEEYTEDIEAAHEQDIALYEVVSNGAKTTSVKAFAIRTLPTLRMHEHHADELEDKK